MAERCEDYSPICVVKDASSGAEDVADMASLEAMDEAAIQAPQGSEREAGQTRSSSHRNDAPPLDISNYLDPFRSFGWDRLHPFDLKDSVGFPLYQAYLEHFYHLHNKNPPASIADAALKCLKKENNLRMSWLAFKVDVFPSDALLSNDIYKCMLQLVRNGGQLETPFVIDAATCIAKEAGLMTMILRQRLKLPISQYILSQDIRRWALKLAMLPAKWTPDVAAALLGITKEAELLLDNVRRGYLDATETSSKIRRSAIEFLCYKFVGIENDEMASDAADSTIEVNQPTWGLAGEFEKDEPEKKCDNMDEQLMVQHNGNAGD